MVWNFNRQALRLSASPNRLFCWLIATTLGFFSGTLHAANDEFHVELKPLLMAHCVKCHGPTKQAGDFRVDDLTGDPARDGERLLAVRDQLRDGLMPPAKEARIDPEKSRAAVRWLGAQIGRTAPKLPNQGNQVSHELLFGSAKDASASAPRVWRLSPEGYMGFVREVGRGNPVGIVQPFTAIPERGIKDFAGLYTIDEPSAEVLLRNAEAIVEKQTAHEIRDGVIRGKLDSVGEFVKLMNAQATPTRKEIEAAVQTQFRLAIGRSASDEEAERFLTLYDKCVKDGNRPAALKTVLQAVLLKTDAMFRSELGIGSGDDAGRRMLGPDELSRAISLALGDRRDAVLLAAARKGELTTREQIAQHVRRILDDPKADTSRVPRFFREYFEYHRALDVFKDRPKSFVHEPRTLVSDTDRLVMHIVKADKDVFRELLTTRLSFVNYATKQNKQTRKDEPVPAVALNPQNNKGQQNVHFVYGVPEWPSAQPTAIPENTRIGILMQPSWLAAFSTNFENDPVRRGRWIRERLLGGTVPDLPIGVAAQVPDEPHRPFRERLAVTRAAECWKCHQRMDDLGLPFEAFDHYGRFRVTETVLDVDATEKNVDKNGKPLGAVTREVKLDTTGRIADSGDANLDGPVADPREMIRKIASSDRARQVFVRHAFRYFLGRNETLSDAASLQQADRAYVESGGSFKALVVALLTSDSFLYRIANSGESK